MHAIKIEIENYLSLENIKLDLTKNLNIVLGKNESGKSNFFRALRDFNSVENDWSKIITRNQKKNKKDIKIKAYFEISREEIEESLLFLDEMYPNLECELNSSFFIEKIISCDGKNKLNSNIILKVNIEKINKILTVEGESRIFSEIKEIDLKIEKNENIYNKNKNILVTSKEIQEFLDVIEDNVREYSMIEIIENRWVHVGEENYIKFVKNINKLIKEGLLNEGLLDDHNYSIIQLIDKVHEISSKIDKDSSSYSSEIKSLSSRKIDLEKEFSEKIFLLNENEITSNLIKNLNFHFFLWEYKEEFLLNKTIMIKDFKENKDKSSLPLWNIFKHISKITGTTIENLIKLAESDEIVENSEIEEFIENYLNKEFGKHWNSKHTNIDIFKNIKFSCKITNSSFRISMKESGESNNTNHSVFEERSDGFKRMASIILSLDNDIKNKIILIDEAETHIHLDGQIKLYDLFSKISLYQPIVFSTISPFMISDRNEDNFLIFDKNKNQHTTITNKKYVDPNGIAMIYGVDIYEYFLLPKLTIIFEGRTDKSFFLNIFTITKINLHKVRLIEMGGVGKIHQEIDSIFDRGTCPFIIAIFDNDMEGKKGRDDSKEIVKKYNYESRLLLLSDILDNDIEVLEDVYPDQVKKRFYDEFKISQENRNKIKSFNGDYFKSIWNDEKNNGDKNSHKTCLSNIFSYFCKGKESRELMLENDNIKKITTFFKDILIKDRQ